MYIVVKETAMNREDSERILNEDKSPHNNQNMKHEALERTAVMMWPEMDRIEVINISNKVIKWHPSDINQPYIVEINNIWPIQMMLRIIVSRIS